MGKPYLCIKTCYYNNFLFNEGGIYNDSFFKPDDVKNNEIPHHFIETEKTTTVPVTKLPPPVSRKEKAKTTEIKKEVSCEGK